ncbi:MAG: galactose mutarotase [Lachnospiraceae bacterium]|nr:galactose mutarotase [Lachnospiraceae bacterium]
MNTDFGMTRDGKKALLYTIRSKKGMCAQISNFGCAVVSLMVPVKDGTKIDVVLGYPNVSGYEDNPLCAGCCIGRVANRTGRAVFTLEGKEYHLEANENGNNLHSSLTSGFHKRIWETVSEKEDSVSFRMESPDGDEGFPGSCTTTVTYTLTDDNELVMRYDGVCSQPTPWNVTNHSYFNLSGHDSGSTEDTVIWLDASAFTPVDAESIPTGEIAPVAGTPMDFTVPTAIGEHLHDDYEQLKLTGGYDHNYCLNHKTGELSLFCRAVSPKTGLTMEVSTDLPGVQFYTGNFIGEAAGKNGAVYRNYDGFCLETQYYPDNLNKEQFASSVIEPGKTCTTVTVYKFS